MRFDDKYDKHIIELLNLRFDDYYNNIRLYLYICNIRIQYILWYYIALYWYSNIGIQSIITFTHTHCGSSSGRFINRVILLL